MTKKTPRLYFAYGSNLNLGQMQMRCPLAKPLCVADLIGWRLVFKTHADVIPDPKARVTGAVYEITPACEWALDRYEGFPNYYVKHEIKASGGKQVMFYVMTDRRTLAMPSDGYLSCIHEGYRDWRLNARSLTNAVRWTERRTRQQVVSE